MCRAIYFALLSVAVYGAVNCAAIGNEFPPGPGLVAINDIGSSSGPKPEERVEELERSTKIQHRYTLGSRVEGTIHDF